MKRLLTAAVVSAILLAGCGGQDEATGAAPTATRTAAAPASSPVPADAAPLLSRYGLEGMDAVEIIDHLDRLGGEDRPADLMASVRPGELVMSAGAREVSLTIPEDRFYLSVAPYVDQTHDCFHHSLTTCQGELAAQDVEVQIVDATGTVLVDETRTTFDNGFVGFWLPRNIEGTLRISHDGRVGSTEISTGPEAPTCLTTLQLT